MVEGDGLPWLLNSSSQFGIRDPLACGKGWEARRQGGMPFQMEPDLMYIYLGAEEGKRSQVLSSTDPYEMHIYQNPQ